MKPVAIDPAHKTGEVGIRRNLAGTLDPPGRIMLVQCISGGPAIRFLGAEAMGTARFHARFRSTQRLGNPDGGGEDRHPHVPMWTKVLCRALRHRGEMPLTTRVWMNGQHRWLTTRQGQVASWHRMPQGVQECLAAPVDRVTAAWASSQFVPQALRGPAQNLEIAVPTEISSFVANDQRSGPLDRSGVARLATPLPSVPDVDVAGGGNNTLRMVEVIAGVFPEPLDDILTPLTEETGCTPRSAFGVSHFDGFEQSGRSSINSRCGYQEPDHHFDARDVCISRHRVASSGLSIMEVGTAGKPVIITGRSGEGDASNVAEGCLGERTHLTAVLADISGEPEMSGRMTEGPRSAVLEFGHATKPMHVLGRDHRFGPRTRECVRRTLSGAFAEETVSPVSRTRSSSPAHDRCPEEPWANFLAGMGSRNCT